MNHLVLEWFSFLKTTDAAVAIPLVMTGSCLMLYGWRLWKVCVFLSFCLIGAGIGASLVRSGDDRMYAAATGAAAMGALSFCPTRYAVGVLSGMIGGMLTMQTLDSFAMPAVALWMLVFLSFGACAAYAFLYRRFALIAITAGLGACLTVSGLMVVVMQWPSIYRIIRSLAESSSFVLAFLLIVPTVMSTLYQVGAVNRNQVDF